MKVSALQIAKADWPILDQEQWYGLLSAAIARELVNAGFEQEFAEDEAESFLYAPTADNQPIHALFGSVLCDVVQEITMHVDTIEDCAQHAALFAKCYVKANYVTLLRRRGP
jgi:hypothetical protein